ncbi:MAG: sigma 54-interacting transcriptional regulator [Desulfobacterales bacterium]|jgi:transcriptional regulator with GAF, ATPase, and Fis domain
MEKEQLKSLLEISAAIAAISNKNELHKVAVNGLQRLVGFDDAAVIVFMNQGRDYMHYLDTDSTERFSSPLSMTIDNNILPIKGSPVEYFLQREDLYEWQPKNLVEKFPNNPGIQRLQQTGIKYSFNLKLHTGGREIGFLILHFKKKFAFRANQQSFFQSIANQLAGAIQNILIKEELEDREKDKSFQLSINNALLNTTTKEELCFTLANLLNDHVPFEMVTLRIWSGSGLLTDWLAIEKEEQGGFRSINDQISREAAQELRVLEKNKNSLDKLPGIFTADKFNELCNRFPIYAYAQKAYRIRSVLRLPFNLSMDKSAHIIFSSKKDNAYTAKHLSILEHCVAQISLALDNLLALKQLKQEKIYLEEEIKTEHNFEEIVGTSSALREVLQKVSQVAPTQSTVLIQGETGTGKELIARAIHKLSPQKDRTLLKVNCAALSPQLIESELFGHEKGSFTGATERRIGKFELANESTIFLDEIGELPVELQAKILRVLQEKEIERIGGKNTLRVDIRIVAATNRDLLKMVSRGEYRSDLFYRLNVFPIYIPPLRERKEDIPLLAAHFIEKSSKKLHKYIETLTDESLNEMLTYHWPGNVRELEHVIERAVILSEGQILSVPIGDSSSKSMNADAIGPSHMQTLKELESQHILQVLRHCNGKVRGKDGAAAILDIKPTTLESRMKKLGIKKEYVLSSS